MIVWADADSLPEDVRRLVSRRARGEDQAAEAAGRAARFEAVFVAARMPPIDEGPGVRRVIVPEGEGSADDRIAALSKSGDLAITRDIPLAERLALAGLVVINDRGDVFTRENAGERRSMRDRAAELRALGLAPESPRKSSRGPKEMKAFADALDRELTKILAKNP